MAALADGGPAIGRLEAALHGRVGHVGDAQLRADIFQQLYLFIQQHAAAGAVEQDGRRTGPVGQAGQAQQ